MIARAWWWAAFVVVVAVGLYWPAVEVGFLADDVYQIALIDGVAGERGPLGLYSLYPEDAEATAEHVRRGSLPWWTVAEFRFVQVRPLSSLLLWVDHALWPKDGVTHHVHSLGWLVAALLAAYAAVRRATTPVIAGVALLVYAVDETFGWTTAWLANRCAMVAAAFGFGALAVHLRRAERARASEAAERGGGRDAWLEGALWGLAFAAGEYALCGVAYVIAHALVGRRDGWRVRARALVPAGVCFVGFAVASAAIGAGVHGATSYVDPVGHPLEFAIACVQRVPRMLGEIWLGLPGESDRLFFRYEGTIVARAMMAFAGVDGPEGVVQGHGGFVLLVLVVGGGVGWWLARRWLTEDERRAAAWMALGSLGALVPLAAILPSTRALALAALGPAVCVGSVGVAAGRALRALLSDALEGKIPLGRWKTSGGLVRLRVGLLGAIAAGLLLQHVIVDAGWARAQIAGIGSTGRAYQRFVAGPGMAGVEVEGKHVVVIGSPGLVTGLHSLWITHLLGRPLPATWHVLQIGERRLLVRRVDARTLEVSTVGTVMHDQPQEVLFRPPPEALHVGDEVDAGVFRAKVVGEGKSGGVMAVRFTFDRPLEDPALVFLVGGPEGLGPFALPAVGKATAVAAPVLPGQRREDR
jgi:hypothetical protein